jgi:ubiquinone/menaquinone biosynthesis C-methylase UbiE
MRRPMSEWVGLGNHVSFKQGDATNLPFGNKTFDAAMTIHVAMNIAAKDKMYMEAHSCAEARWHFRRL